MVPRFLLYIFFELQTQGFTLRFYDQPFQG